jgi:hypothetical protein
MVKMENEKNKKLNIKEFMGYVHENFHVSGEASRLIENVLKYAGIEEPEKRHDFLCFVLDGTIGLTEEEIGRISL